MVTTKSFARLCAVLIIATVAATPSMAQISATGAEQFEVPVNRKASEILPAELLKGPNYQVRESVVSYGYMDHWIVDSDFGVFEVTGDGALRALIREIYAIAALEEISKGKAFADALLDSAKQPGEFAKKMITHPVDTVSALPKGVYRFFENVGTGITTKHDPSEDSRLQQALFVSSWKRHFAAQYGVDVYSSNKVLQEQLNKVGWASAVGQWGFSAALMPFGGTAALVIKNTRFVNGVAQILKEEPPSRLRIINNDKLSAMGIKKKLRKAFLDHPIYTPRQDTIIVAALADLKDSRGRHKFIEAALSAEDEVSATFFMNIAQTLQGYNETVSPIEDISLDSGVTIARAENGRALIPFPLDHGVWTERASDTIRHMKQTYEADGFQGNFDFWITGTVTPRAQNELASMGLEVNENVDEKIGFLD